MAKMADVVLAARRTLQDYDADRWDDDVLLVFANGARRAYAEADPTAYTVTIPFTLAAGVEQQCPADCIVFYEVPGTLKTDGSQSKAVTVTQREFLDTFVPSWRSMPAAETQHFLFNERARKEFQVYPPAKAGAKVLLRFSQGPADLALLGDLSDAESRIQDALADYTVARALLQDAESPSNQSRAVMHLQLFAAATGASLVALLKNSPNTANVGGRLPKVATGA